MSVFRIIDGNLHISTTTGLAEVPPELEQKLERTANSFLNKLRMPLPENPELPFFAYGLFKPGQLGFDVLRDFVEESKPEHVLGDLMEKDGVPLFVDGCSKVGGVLLKFASDKAADAYQQIASIEPSVWRQLLFPVNDNHNSR